MEAVRQWSFSLCAAMMACSMLRLLLPKGSMHRIYSLTLSVFILCVLLSPFFFARPELELDLQTQPDREIDLRAQKLTDTVVRQGETAASGELEKIVFAKLEEMGIKYHSVTIHISINGQNNGAGGQVAAELVLDAQHSEDRAAIRQALSEGLGIPFTIAFS